MYNTFNLLLIIPSRILPELFMFSAGTSFYASSQSDEIGSPLLLGGVLILCFACLVLMGLALVVALIGLVCVGILAFCGMVSSAVIIGLVRRRFSSGLRALHYQVLTALTIPWGIVALWLCSAVTNAQLGLGHVLLLGTLAGILAGIGFAFLLDVFVRLVFRWFKPSTAAKPALPSKSLTRS